MNQWISRIRRPVEREGAEHYLRITLLSFAGSVILTRVYLELTGYPQIGGGTLHVAHVLFGGLLLFIAALLPLVFANRAAYTAGAVLGGVGVGLFIDEVGKFITATNDYFFQPAAPIIYAFFLLTILVYVRVRRPPSQDARAELYRALDSFQEVLDHDLDARERTELGVRLRRVIQQATDPDLERLGKALLDFLDSDTLALAPERPGALARLRGQFETIESRYLGRRRLRTLLGLGLGLAGLVGAAQITLAVTLFFSPIDIRTSLLETLARAGQVRAPSDLFLLSGRLALEGVTGVSLALAAVLILIGRDRLGTLLAYYALLFSLTVINLLVFYFDQFGAVVASLFQFALLLATVHYRRRYLVH